MHFNHSKRIQEQLVNYLSNDIAILAAILLTVSLIAGCGKAAGDTKTSTTLTNKQLVPVAVSSSEDASTQRWKNSFNKGIELVKQNKLTEASYYFTNALGASPGNFAIIEAYCQTMLKINAQENGTGNDTSLLQIIEGFLQSQMPLVSFEEVPKILAILEEVRKKIDAESNPAPQSNAAFDTLLAEIESGQYQVPQTGEELSAALENIGDVRDYAVRQNPDKAELHKKIDNVLNHIQSAVDFQTLTAALAVRKAAVQESLKTSATIAEYQLQECEQVVRAMVALPSHEFQTKITEEFQQLKSLAEGITEKKGLELWNETKHELDKEAKERYTAKTYQKKLEILSQETFQLQRVLPSLKGEGWTKAMEWQKQLSETATDYSNKQSQAYNKWAMECIQNCLADAHASEGGILTGGKNWEKGRIGIAAALITHLAPIDRRFLTAEVSRAYDEVLNKYLAPNQLNPVKDNKSIDEPGNILHTLNSMYEKKKIPLSDF